MDGAVLLSRAANLPDRVLRNGPAREDNVAVYAAGHGRRAEQATCPPTIGAVDDLPRGVQSTYQFVFEVDRAEKPSCVTDVVIRYVAVP